MMISRSNVDLTMYEVLDSNEHDLFIEYVLDEFDDDDMIDESTTLMMILNDELTDEEWTIIQTVMDVMERA